MNMNMEVVEMGFVKDVAKVGTFGLAGLAFGNRKKKDPLAPPSMISSPTTATRPYSMIGSSRGGY